jgi:N-carbamoylputrescine amidase
MRIAFCELPDGTLPQDASWARLAEQVAAEAPDLLVMNEVPFGPWFATTPEVDAARAAQSVELHRRGITALRALGARAVLTSAPVQSDGRLVNEALLIEPTGERVVHQKHYFPDEAGFYEARWFATTRPGFEPVVVGELVVGVLLCSELMFNEWARHYRQRGANVIAVPRASGTSHARWRTAAAMAAIVSGCYVISSNRSGRELGFGGGGFAFGPSGDLIAETSEQSPVRCIELELAQVHRAQASYPCSLGELPPG